MDEALYLNDCYLKEFDAKVVSVKDGKFVVLDKTIFYPKSGGQPEDLGVLKKGDEEFKVVFAGKFDGHISHEVDHEGLQEGDEVHGVLDWERRYELMRYHTAAHILSGMFHKEAGAKITGGGFDIGKGRIDFDLEDFDRERMQEFFDKSNAIVREDHEIKVYTMPREEALAIPEMLKLANVLPPSIKELRIIDIVDFDRQPDGGTHVHKTGEVGKITFMKAENKGKNNRRVYFSLE
ncbi:MAG: alanyl-tRNA editing protein AlaXM [archaeon]